MPGRSIASNRQRQTAEMADKKIIAVVGATGAQGGGLVRAILNDLDGGLTARAITRDPGSDKEKVLAGAGAEVFEANIDDHGTALRVRAEWATCGAMLSGSSNIVTFGSSFGVLSQKVTAAVIG